MLGKCRFFNSRKSQITIFIILGILLIVGVILYFAISARVIDRIEGESFPVVEEIPTEFQPVREYVDFCVERISEQAIRKIGDQGGYIFPSDHGIVAIEEEPTSSNGVFFSPGSTLTVPYWWYLESDNKCTGSCVFSSERPPLYRTTGTEDDKSIESQIDRFVNEKLRSCLVEFEGLEVQGFIIEELGDIETETTIAEKNVDIFVKYPLKAQIGTSDYIVSEYFVRHPVNLKRVYELATYVTNMQAQYQYIERDVLNLIVAFGGVDKDKLPPMTNLRFELGSEVMWQKSEVQKKVEQTLESYIQMLQVDGTLNYEYRSFPGDELKEAIYNKGMIIPVNRSYPELAITFNYLQWWPIHFDLNCEGELCRPMSATAPFLSVIGLQQYNFAYDVSFPTLVAIYDPSSFNERGYTFNFFLESNIRNNKVMKFNFTPLAAVSAPVGTMLCDPDKRNSGPVVIEVKDTSQKPIEGVEVMYTCAAESCNIGKTDSEGKLREAFPVCLGGIVTLSKQSYLGKSVLLDTELGQGYKVPIFMDKMFGKKVVVKKHKVVKSNDEWTFSANPVDLDPNEEAIIVLERMQDDLGEEDFSTFARFEGDQIGSSDIMIAPGTYRVKANLILDENIKIPEDERTEGVWPVQTEFTIPEIEFNESFPSGGVEGVNWRFSRKILEDNDEIVFYMISPDIKGIPESERKIEDLDQMNKIGEYSQAYAVEISPELR